MPGLTMPLDEHADQPLAAVPARWGGWFRVEITREERPGGASPEPVPRVDKHVV